MQIKNNFQIQNNLKEEQLINLYQVQKEEDLV